MNACSVLWCGKYKQDWENGIHEHNFFQLIIVTAGHGYVLLDDERIEISAQYAVLVHPGQSHAVICTDKDPLQLCDIKFSIRDPAFFADVNALPAYLVLEDFSWYLYCFDTIIHESQNQAPYYFSLICDELYRLLVHLLRDQHEAFKTNDTPPLGQADIATYHGVDVRALMQYIYFNYSHIITLDDLSEAAGINKTTLITLFKELYGTTPIRYINQLRMQKAKELLSNTDTSIGEIADLIGFQSIHYFSRFFKTKESCTPLEYRMRHSQSRYYSFT